MKVSMGNKWCRTRRDLLFPIIVRWNKGFKCQGGGGGGCDEVTSRGRSTTGKVIY